MAKVGVVIENGEQVLAGKLFTPQAPNGSAALFVHGFNGSGRSCEQYAKRLTQFGTTSFTFDLSGHGSSSGNNDELTVNDHVADAGSAFDYLASQEEVAIDPQRIGIAGMSYGGYLATLLTTSHSAKSLLFRSPPLYPADILDTPRQEYTDEYALYGETTPDHPALVALRSFAGRVLLVVSEHDTVVLPRVTDLYNDAAMNGTRRTLEGAQHSLDAGAQQVFKPMVDDWAQSL